MRWMQVFLDSCPAVSIYISTSQIKPKFYFSTQSTSPQLLNDNLKLSLSNFQLNSSSQLSQRSSPSSIMHHGELPAPRNSHGIPKLTLVKPCRLHLIKHKWRSWHGPDLPLSYNVSWDGFAKAQRWSALSLPCLAFILGSGIFLSSLRLLNLCVT